MTLRTASLTRTVEPRVVSSGYSMLMTVAGTDGNGTFSISQRYTRQLATQYAHMVSLEIARRGRTSIQVLLGVSLAIDSVVVLTPDGIVA